MIRYDQAKFLTSAANLSQCPLDTGFEVAFIGRSNAGKSSAINTLTRQKSLARTSKTPGRTQLLNFFNLNPEASLRLVDLPGYGFAQVSLEQKKQWEKNVGDYLAKRDSLQGLVIVMDARHAFKPADNELIEWCCEGQLPCHLLMTKSDKLNNSQRAQLKREYDKKVNQVEQTLSWQWFSALKVTGKDDLVSVLNKWLVP